MKKRKRPHRGSAGPARPAVPPAPEVRPMTTPDPPPAPSPTGPAGLPTVPPPVPPMPPPDTSHYSAEFEPVLAHELAEVRRRRGAVIPLTAKEAEAAAEDEGVRRAEPPGTRGAVYREAQRMDLFGLALSGGGIRSATLNLGILQALAGLGLLKRVDYISSVSGGGYVHAWLAAWVRRETTRTDADGRPVTPVENVSKQMSPSRVAQAQASREGLAFRHVRADEPAPVHHLREYSRYLAPRGGLLALDFWALLGLYLRNLLANGLLFVAAGLVLSLVCRLAVHAFTSRRAVPVDEWAPFAGFAGLSPLFAGVAGWRPLDWVGPGWRDGLPWAALIAALVLLGIAQLFYRKYLAEVRSVGRRTEQVDAAPNRRTADEAHQRIRRRVVYLCLWGCVIGLWLVGPSGAGSRLPGDLRLTQDDAGTGSNWLATLDGKLDEFNVPDEGRHYLWTGLAFGLFGLVSAAAGLGYEQWVVHRDNRSVASDAWQRWIFVPLGGAAFGVLFGLILTAVEERLGFAHGDALGVRHPTLFVAFGPPLLMLGLTVCGYLEAIVSGRYLSEPEREWRARVGALTMFVGLVWAGVFAVVLYVPWLVERLGRAYGWAAVGGWLATGAASYLLRPTGAAPSDRAVPWRSTRVILAVAPLVFLVGLVALASAAAHQLPGVSGDVRVWEARAAAAGAVSMAEPPVPHDFLTEAEAGSWPATVVWLLGLAAAGIVYAYLIEPNLFSLHSVYGNRLVRCYLAASRKKAGWTTPPSDRPPNEPSPGVPTGVNDAERDPDVFTGFGYRDDLSLLWLQPDTSHFPPAVPGVDEPWRHARTPYLGPYPLFNTALNTVAGADLANQDRKGESFVLSPGYCGSGCTGWARLRIDPARPYLARNLSVGRAMTISGAAVDPNMQFFQSAGLTALLTLFNLRLGWWIKNPWTAADDFPGGQTVPWQADTPRSARFLIWEALGRTRPDTEYVHLSDGGHFENTGAYELIRRRCRFIVLIDAAEDGADASENLANLMRLVRTDFGVRIEMDTSPLRKDANERSRAHTAVGLIRYDDVDNGAVNGTLLFVRSSLTGDEPADLLNYAANYKPFPHHSTGDQFFDEAQFESYRCLGHHIGMSVFGPAATELDRRPPDDRRFARRLFAELRERWAVLPAGLADRYHAAIDGWMRVEESMRKEPRAVRLTLDMFPEIHAAVRAGLPDGVGAALATARGLPPPPSPALDTLDPVVLQWAAAGEETRVAELRVMSELVQMMETAWLQMDLDSTFAHPMQRGWMNCFRRYTAADVFQQYWPVLRPLYAAGFVRFCERVLNVAPVPLTAVPWGPGPDAHRGPLVEEFRREWAAVLDPNEPDWRPDYLEQMLIDAAAFGAKTNRPTAWVFRYGRPGQPWDVVGSAGRLPDYPVGVAAVRPVADGGAADDPDHGGYFELFYWVRGGHRSSEVGRECLPPVLEQVAAAVRGWAAPGGTAGAHRALFTRFPRVGGTAADSFQRALWTTFFNDHDFAAYQLTEATARREVRLRRWLPRHP